MTVNNPTLFAIPAVSATDARSWVPAVRWSLSILGADGSEVRFRDVLDHVSNHPDFPGWDHWGTTLKRNKPYPKAHRAVTLAAGKLKEAGFVSQPRRGYYMLTTTEEAIEEVVEEIVTVETVRDTPPTPVAVVKPSPAPARGLTVVPAPPSSTPSTYEHDAGLARIAIAQTRCYGWFSERSASCKGCPLVALCQQAKMVNVAETAALLDREIENQIRQQQEQEEAQAASAVSLSPYASDLVVEDTSSDTGAPDPVETAAEPTIPTGATSMDSLPFEVYCSGCSSTIAAGSPAVHLPGKGAFHPSCAAK